MEPIFDFSARTVAWLSSDIAFGGDGLPVAFIDDGSVFAAESGQYLGRFCDGVFRERLGCIVAFTHEAGQSNVLPSLANMVSAGTGEPPRIRSRSMPGHARSHIPHLLAKPLLNRSSLDWGRFILGSEARWPWETRA